jgi:hypothetical protein
MVLPREETKGNVNKPAPAVEPSPPRKMSRKAVSIRRGRLCFVPVDATESGENELKRPPSPGPARRESTSSS